MPKRLHQSDASDELYDQTKSLRLNETNKRLRHLRRFERIYYKNTCEVKKTGHNLEDVHRLDDGNLRYGTRNLTYSLNKKKRWLLPEIIEQRICESDAKSKSSASNKHDRSSSVDDNLKIVMYKNENVRYSSNCIRYANSQTEPRVLHKNGRRFNSTTLTKWMDFNTHQLWQRNRRNTNEDRVNQPNFGFQQRPGFFPSEVTYEFLYPKHLPSSETFRKGRISLWYYHGVRGNDFDGRHFKDTNQNRRKVRRNFCSTYDVHEQDYTLEEEDEEDYLCSLHSSEMLDEHDRWSIVFEDSNDSFSTAHDFSIDCFIPSPLFQSHSDDTSSDIVIDHKAHKYYEPLSTPDKKIEKPVSITETLLCTIPYPDESKFLSIMQQPSLKITQANLSPPMFVQRTLTSTFSVVYTYSRQTSLVTAVLKFADTPPKIDVDEKQITLPVLIQLISHLMDEKQVNSIEDTTDSPASSVDALRGSLPLPRRVAENMLLVRPHSTNRQRALQIEKINNENVSNPTAQWFDTAADDYAMLECSICCEILTAEDAHRLLPCHHVLCHSCLTAYIRTSVPSATFSSSSSSAVITCFQPDCATQLNSALLQAFVSYEIYQAYYQSLIDRQLFSSGHYRKCPSRICSNLLIVDDETKPSLMCSCGQRVCSKCLEEYHFPATCQQYKSYATRLRESGDDVLSTSKVEDNSHCYIAEGKNCPNCGEFVEKNGGCPHMTCKCGNEYCWMCLRRWATHNYSTCFTVPESTHELRSSTRNRLHNKAINHRRNRNQHSFNLLTASVQHSKHCSPYYDKLLSTYIDLNTLAEFLYVFLQRRRLDSDIRAVLGQTARRLNSEAFQLKLQIDCEQIRMDHVEQIRARLERTFWNLLHMKKTKILVS